MVCATHSIRTCGRPPIFAAFRPALVAATIGLAGVVPGLNVRAAELEQSPSHYPPCTGETLAGFPWTHQAFGKSIPGIALRNVTLAPCRVAGFPQIRAYETTGQLALLHIEQKMFIDTTIYAYTVTPGSAVFFALYGQAPRGQFDRSCVGIGQIDVLLPGDRQPIDVTVASGTCGGRLTESQIFPVAELAR